MGKQSNKNKAKGKGYNPAKSQGQKNKGKGKGSQTKRSSTESTEDRVQKDNPDRKYENHPTYWNKTGQLTNDVASFSFHSPVGAKLKGFEVGFPYFTVPGILRMNYTPCYGDVTSATHPINVAAKRLYDVINSRNSRNTQYDPSDLMIYILAVAQAYGIHAWVRRVAGLFYTYENMNRYWPDIVLKAIGVKQLNHTDQVKWRALANRIAIKLNTLIVPDGISYFDRVYDLPLGIYRDSPSEKASLLLFNPIGFLKYEESTEAHPGAHLVFHETPWATGLGVTVDAVEQYFNEHVNELLNSSDICMMGADILKAYGSDHLRTIAAVLPGEETATVIDPYMIMQIKNARVLGDATWCENYVVGQEMSRNIIYSPMSAHTFNGTDAVMWTDVDSKVDYPIAMFQDTPTVDDMIEATRFSFIFSSPGNRFQTCTEVITGTVVYTFNYTDDGVQVFTLKDCQTIFTNASGAINLAAGTSDGVVDHLIGRKLRDYSRFGYAPMQYIVQTDEHTRANVIAMYCLSDFENYTTIDGEDLREINECATLSIFDPTGAINKLSKT